MLAGKKRLVSRIAVVEFQGRFHRGLQTRKRNRFIAFMRDPRAVAAVDGAIGIEEENRERQVAVELKKRHVEAVGLHDANANEFVEKWSKLGVLTSELPV